MTVQPTVHRPRLWLAIASLLAVVAIGALWSLREAEQVCILIYPSPPGCGDLVWRTAPMIGIGLVIALAAAAVVVYFTVSRPRTALILLTAAIVVVAVVSVLAVILPQGGIVITPEPPVIVD